MLSSHVVSLYLKHTLFLWTLSLCHFGSVVTESTVQSPCVSSNCSPCCSHTKGQALWSGTDAYVGQTEIWGFLKISHSSPMFCVSPLSSPLFPLWSVLQSFSDSSQSHWAFPSFNLWPASLFPPCKWFLFSTFSVSLPPSQSQPFTFTSEWLGQFPCQPVCSSDSKATLKLMCAVLSAPSPHSCLVCDEIVSPQA